MTADELDMLAELEAKATKGPWKSGCVGQHEDERPVMFYRATGYEPPETITDSMRQGAINLSLVDSLRNAAPSLIALARWAIEQRIKMQAASIMSDSVSYRACIAAALAAYPKGGWDARLLQRD